MTQEALLTICIVLVFAMSLLNYFGYRKLEARCRQLDRLSGALKSELRLGEANEAAVLRKLLALKRTESRMIRTRAQMEIATRACWSMLSRSRGKAKRQQQGGNENG